MHQVAVKEREGGEQIDFEKQIRSQSPMDEREFASECFFPFLSYLKFKI